MRDFGVVIAAAGAGKRFGARKQLLRLLGRPLLHYALDAFSSTGDVAAIVIVMAPDDLETGRELVRLWQARRLEGGEGAEDPSPRVVAGGPRRQDSVRLGLEALPAEARFVLVHDAARPLIRSEDIRRMIDATREHGAAAIGSRVVDSVKRVRDRRIVEELPRDEIWTVQTPQSARVAALLDAYSPARSGSAELTDEASALRAMGVEVALVDGPRENFKITQPGDEALAEMVLRTRELLRERPSDQ